MKFNPNDPKYWVDFDPFAKATDYIDGKSEATINKGRGNRLKSQDLKFIETMKSVQSSDQYKEAISTKSLENWKNSTYRRKNSDGKKRTWATDEKRKQQVSEQFSKSKTHKHRLNMKESQLAFYQSEEGKQILKQKADKQRGIPRTIVKCPHCGKEGGEGIMYRWHFDNCKHK